MQYVLLQDVLKLMVEYGGLIEPVLEYKSHSSHKAGCSCCYCSVCRHHHDDCVCIHNQAVEDITDVMRRS